MWKSDDGVNWSCLIQFGPWVPRWQHASCVHNGYMYIIGGWGDDFLNDGMSVSTCMYGAHNTCDLSVSLIYS